LTIALLALGVDAETSLVDAHQLSSELEEELRLQIPNIADVIVHTGT
jgi:divalent metal cation (Fe/Co/Zn/Cd) transporter